MSQRTIRVDDLDGTTEGARPITFAVDGVTYDIDLTEENLHELRNAFSPFIDAARPRPKPKQGSKPKVTREQLAAIRQWGHANGYEFSDQGRIPNHVLEAFEKFGG
jgi:hypothetical protein